MKFSYKTNGVCARTINFEIEDDKIKNVKFIGGCSGNTQGVSVLVEGMDINEVIEKLHNIKCGFKNTSCPAQLAQAIKEYKAKKGD